MPNYTYIAYINIKTTYFFRIIIFVYKLSNYLILNNDEWQKNYNK